MKSVIKLLSKFPSGFLIALITIFFSLNSFSEDKKISCEFFQDGETESWRWDVFIFNTDDFKKDIPVATHNWFIAVTQEDIDLKKRELDEAAWVLERGKQLNKNNHISDKSLENFQETHALAKEAYAWVKLQLAETYVRRGKMEEAYVNSNAVNYSVTPTHILFTLKRQMLPDVIHSINRETLERHAPNIPSSSICKISDFKKENLF